ncbi:MAG: OmpH family outer membrane protein [Gemmatimonadetes bacterium]|nr:OmpH family outer membrane protein [Gemmatimonadota bacterium]MYD25473.1 OmpH family outer membrane protein [Gemmatimonadota bacterium]MYI98917.1 OmpH family outer membrane protein [Gemmatimonadota bacterium]
MVSGRGMIRIAAVLAAVILLPVVTQGQELKIGYLDMERLRQSYQGFRDAEEAFQTQVTAMQEQVQSRQQEVEMLKQQYEARKTMLTAARRQQDEQNIMQKEQELIQFAQSQQMQLAQQEVELTRPLQESIFNVVQTLAKAENYTYVFDAGSLIYVDPLRAQDLTGQVLEELQKEAN